MTVYDKVRELHKDLAFYPKGGQTFCNRYLLACAKAIGCHDLPEALANDQVDYMAGHDHAWMKVSPALAGKLASRGFFVVAGAKNPEGHGHVAVVVPGLPLYSPSLNDEAPLVASCGSEKATFIGRHAGYAFSKGMAPSYFFWMGFPT